MTLRFRRTIDVSPHMFSTRQHAETDWVLYCGGWLVGRIHENQRPIAPRIVFVWSLTGPVTPEAPVTTRGEALTVAAAKGQLAPLCGPGPSGRVCGRPTAPLRRSRAGS